MESKSSTVVITDECKMPEASKGFGVCSLGIRQGGGVRMPEGGPEGGGKQKRMLNMWTCNGIHEEYHLGGKNELVSYFLMALNSEMSFYTNSNMRRLDLSVF